MSTETNFEEAPCWMCGNEDLVDRHDAIIPVIYCEGEDCGRVYHSICLGMTPKGFLRMVDAGKRWRCPGCVVNSVPLEKEPAPEAKKGVYYYMRVSTKGQDNPSRGRMGLATQKHAIKAFAVANNLSLTPVVSGGEVGSAWKGTDNLELASFLNHMHPHAISRSMRKAEIQEHLAACGLSTNGTVETLLATARANGLMDKIPPVPVVVYSCDRVARNVAYAQGLVKLAHSVGSYFVSVSEQCTSKDPEFWTNIRAGEAYSRALSMHGKAVRARKAGVAIPTPAYTPFDAEPVKVNQLVEGYLVDKLGFVYNRDTGVVAGMHENGAIRPLTSFERLVCAQLGLQCGDVAMPME